MDVPVSISVELRRVVADAQGRPGKGHLTVNSKSLCEGDGRWMLDHDTERITVKQFLDAACLTCLGRLNGR